MQMCLGGEAFWDKYFLELCLANWDGGSTLFLIPNFRNLFDSIWKPKMKLFFKERGKKTIKKNKKVKLTSMSREVRPSTKQPRQRPARRARLAQSRLARPHRPSCRLPSRDFSARPSYEPGHHVPIIASVSSPSLTPKTHGAALSLPCALLLLFGLSLLHTRAAHSAAAQHARN
jgi:hypothetical protein